MPVHALSAYNNPALLKSENLQHAEVEHLLEEEEESGSTVPTPRVHVYPYSSSSAYTHGLQTDEFVSERERRK